MQLIQNVEARNFRTLRAVSLRDLRDFVPIVGLNGSGKSNLLRALSVFFSGSVEPGVALDLRRDHYDPGRRFGGRRRISVRVTFNLSADYEPRKEVARLLKKLGATDGQLVVERAWQYADPSGTSVTEEFLASADGDPQRLDAEDLASISTFVRSIRFRYVPNHVRPSDLLEAELQTLRRAINRRVRSRAAFRTGGVQDALADFGAVTREMIQPASSRVIEHTPELVQIVPDIPQDFADLAFQLGLRTVGVSGIPKPPDLEGSGTQSYLLFHMLDLIDRSAFEVDFGWTKAIVWAIEEPESFLHAGLRTRLAGDLVEFAAYPRRQVFITTHEPEFQRVAEEVWIAQRSGVATTVGREEARTAVIESSKLRISSFQHPLFLSPDRPLVLAEGTSDVTYLRRTAEVIGLKPFWSLVSLDELESGKSGGSDVDAYIRANPSVLRSRPLHAPIIVLRDWEVADSVVKRIQQALGVHESSVCLRPPESLCNPDLSQKFRGIERFLSTSLVEATIPGSLHPKSLSTRYPLFIEKDDLEANKQRLLKAFEGSSDPGDHLQRLVEWLDMEVLAAVGKAPTAQMLLPY